jgi:hypothetical protein
MKNLSVYVAIACFTLAMVIFVFGSGGARIYSGGFFTILGIVNLVAAKGRAGRGKNEGGRETRQGE